MSHEPDNRRANEAESAEPRRRTERRSRVERRQQTTEQSGYTGPERRATSVDRRSGLERRRGAGIRRDDERRSAEEGEMTGGQFEFIMAIEAYKKLNKRLYPTWTEILEIFQQLGYRKVQPRRIDLANCPEAPIQKVA